METYYEKYARYDVTSASEFRDLTGISLEIPSGSYYQIIGSTSRETLWTYYGEMDQLYIESENTYLPLTYADNVSYEALNISGYQNMGDAARFVVNDADFERLSAGLDDSSRETQVLFSTEGEMKDKIAFSNELFREFAERMSPPMDVMEYYNAATEEREGAEYTESFTGAIVDPENPLRATDWQFAPLMTPLTDQQNLMELSTRLLMFAYIFIICIAAAGVIGYTRSQNVGLTNQQVFEDIKRLGADLAYRRILMRRQIRKVFVLPTCLGAGLCLLYESLILWNNDRYLASGEIRALLALTAVTAAVILYQYIIYRMSVRKTGHLLNL